METAWALLRSIREAIHRAEFGPTPHPVFSPTHRKALAGASLDPFQAALRDRLLGEAEGPFEDAARLHDLHRGHAALMYGLVPEYPAALERAIVDVRFELAQRASQVSGVEDEMLPGWGGSGYFKFRGLPFFAIWKAFRMMQQARGLSDFSKVEDLRLEHFDFVEEGVVSASAEEVWFRCGGGCDLTRPLASAGRPDRCGCGRDVAVPTPSLVRVAASIHAARDAARGVGRCRVCNQIIQIGKNEVTRTGYCSKLCAKQATR